MECEVAAAFIARLLVFRCRQFLSQRLNQHFNGLSPMVLRLCNLNSTLQRLCLIREGKPHSSLSFIYNFILSCYSMSAARNQLPVAPCRNGITPGCCTADLRFRKGVGRMAKIVGLDGLSPDDLMLELERGGRFVVYRYIVSLGVMTFRRSSAVHFLRPSESAVIRGLPYTIATFLFGWWGIPWGLIWTPQALVTNLAGGQDVTAPVVDSLRSILPDRADLVQPEESPTPPPPPTTAAWFTPRRVAISAVLVAAAAGLYSCSSHVWHSVSTTFTSVTAAQSIVKCGDGYAANGDWDPAVAAYSEAIRREPRLSDAYLARAEALQHQGKSDLALEDYNTVVRQWPAKADAFNGRAVIFARQGNRAAAISDLTRSLALDLDQPEALAARGNLYATQGDLDLALADYNKCIQVRPTFEPAFTQRGVVRLAKGDNDGALQDWNRAILLNSHDAAAHAGRGMIHYARREWDSAISDFGTAIALKPDSPTLYFNRGMAFKAQGDRDHAIEDFQKLLSLPSLDAETADQAKQALQKLQS